MINANGGQVTLVGTLDELLAESTAILAGVYNQLKDMLGEDGARGILAHVGRVAVDPRMTEKEMEYLIQQKTIPCHAGDGFI